MKRDVQCKETSCEYFHKCYEVIKIGHDPATPRSNYTPDLNSVVKKCKHPTLESKEGIRINELKKCPNVEESR